MKIMTWINQWISLYNKSHVNIRIVLLSYLIYILIYIYIFYVNGSWLICFCVVLRKHMRILNTGKTVNKKKKIKEKERERKALENTRIHIPQFFCFYYHFLLFNLSFDYLICFSFHFLYCYLFCCANVEHAC